jgi:hypothetical protein
LDFRSKFGLIVCGGGRDASRKARRSPRFLQDWGRTNIALEGRAVSGRKLILTGVALGVAALLALGAVGYFLGWWPHTRHQPDPVPARSSPHNDSFSARNWSYYLRPVPTGRPGPTPTAEEAWNGLFPGMAADPSTRELLQRLYGGLPLEFVVLDKGATNDDLTRPPAEGLAVAFRVADLGSRKEKTVDGETLFGLIALGRATFIKDFVSSDSTDAVAGLVKTMSDRPSDGEAFDLAVEDYMLRHQTGWLVVGGPVFDKGRQLPHNPQEHRADLDARIKRYAEKSADFYDKLRGKK